MNLVVLRGHLSGAPQVRLLSSGSTVHSFDLVTTGPDGRAAGPVAWIDPPPTTTLGEHAEVVVVGAVRRRFFRSGGSTQSRTEVVASEVIPASRRARVQRRLALEASRLGEAAGGAVRSV